jgi:hypothetical protein
VTTNAEDFELLAKAIKLRVETVSGTWPETSNFCLADVRGSLTAMTGR